MKTTFTSHIFRGEDDLQHLRAFLASLSREPNVGDFNEQIQLPAIRSITRLWEQADELIAFAFVDSYSNLRFATADGQRSDQIENEIVDWGITCVRQRNAERGEQNTLDASCRADDLIELAFLERCGFVREPIRSLEYSHPLTDPIEDFPLPAGFFIRCVTGEDDAEALVSLHRAAFGTENMTVEERLAIMHAPNYTPSLDLVAVAPNGELSAFCICGLEEDGAGYTDPIGTHPNYQRLGLGKAIVSAGLRALKEHGATVAKTGASSVNVPMQRLAEQLGFVCVAEKLWFSRKVERHPTSASDTVHL
ncbi:MAG: GNAT family N-acetyltransferase [Anaerolineaceae bacterium]|nr:MAG: GNAT family N-acetyltransferase [Anaerolineaceae bacterium]